MRTLLNCPAPAKLNLFLHVTGRRADGYHLLQTVFQLIDRSDMLHFSLRDDDEIHRSTQLAGVPEAGDLTVRAARLLQQAAQQKGMAVAGVDIAIDKQLPMGGGVGGGSSDAATTLLALNHLWQTGLSRRQLMALGLQLGADVPFFLFGHNAFAEGVGEQLAAVQTPARWFVVIEPGVSIPTQQIFSSSELTRDTKPVKISDFSIAPVGFGKNDLQVVAGKLFPPVAEAVEWLRQRSECGDAALSDARMTGSGACVFCSFEHEAQADAVLATAPPQWTAWKARAISQHPLAHLCTS
jgi:4-diphosphocytidyl-2-C-methyl-D-erythritol kinase